MLAVEPGLRAEKTCTDNQRGSGNKLNPGSDVKLKKGAHVEGTVIAELILVQIRFFCLQVWTASDMSTDRPGRHNPLKPSQNSRIRPNLARDDPEAQVGRCHLDSILQANDNLLFSCRGQLNRISELAYPDALFPANLDSSEPS